ncbi:hypothetical protein T12_10214, partial [Trichinella patagoniensis]
MRLCNSRLPEEHFVCYQTSQRNWVIIKVLYRCLQRYMLGWRISRLGFVTPIVGEVSLGPLVKRLAGNEIELGIEIPTIESRASNIPMTKGTTFRYWLLTGDVSRSCLHSSRTRRVVRSPGCDHGHDEESRNGRDIKIDILDDYIWISELFRVKSGFYRSTGRLPEPLGNIMGLNGPSGREERQPR